MNSEIAADVWRGRLRQVVGDHGGPSNVARLAEIPLQTLKNHLGGRTKKAPVADLTRIAEACDVAVAWLLALDDVVERPAGLAEGDAAPYVGPPMAIEAKGTANRLRWVVQSRELELAGYLPGDLCEFDSRRRPRPGEPVVAQLYDDKGSAETVLRLYRPPFLMVHTADPSIDPRPVPLDPEENRVRIMGGFVRLIREPRS